MKLANSYRVAAGLIYLSVGSLVGLLVVPLVVISLALRGLSWLLLVCVPMAASLCLRTGFTLGHWIFGTRADRSPEDGHALGDALREESGKLAALRDGLSFSLPLLRAVADLERLLARSVAEDSVPAEPPQGMAAPREVPGRPFEASWDDLGYLGLLSLGAVWLMPLAALTIPVVAFTVALPTGGPPQQLAFGPGNTILVAAPTTRVLVALLSVLAFAALLGLLFWMGKLRARMVRGILSRLDEAEAKRRAHAAERQRIAALRVNDADYRRLERDLHDGAQARLAVLLMNLAHAKRHKSADADYLSNLVDETHNEIRRALEEMRDLVRGIQPPILSDRGLVAAVTALTERFHVPVTVSSNLDRRPDVRVESTAYYIIAECLANTVKHAAASRIHVRLAQLDNHLMVSVTDDGDGGARLGAGSGLSGLEDRAAALSGRLDLTSPPGGPTTVQAALPWSVSTL